MRYLGIDYGAKRVGVAFSDEAGKIAFPHETFPNDGALLGKLADLCKKENIRAIIIGESRDFKQEENPIMEDAREFADALSRAAGLPVHFEPEFLTTQEARRLPGKGEMPARTRRAGGPREKRKPLPKSDAASAALILQSYLNKTQNSTGHPTSSQ